MSAGILCRLSVLTLLLLGAAGIAGLAGCPATGRPTDPTVGRPGPSVGATKVTNNPMVQRYGETARTIIARVLEENDAYNKLTELCDGVGNRLSGSAALDRAIDWAVATMKRDGHDNVARERVMVRKWVRGNESLVLSEPRAMTLPLLGLGGSVGTPPEGISAEVIVADDKQHLERLGAAVAGKIVLFNKALPPFDPVKGSGYGATVQYRIHGARMAAAHGAVAALVRSVTANSLATPHTGAMSYGDAKGRVPAAAITVEHAELIARLVKAGTRVMATLKMEARDEGEVPSANVLAELPGRERPEEVVVISGHLDSWDVGQGAHDDGAGCVIAMEALTTLRKLGLRPRRTVRVVLWTNEENGLAGGKTYARDHAGELAQHVAAIEADSGGFRPVGFSLDVAAGPRAKAAERRLAELVALLEPLGATKLELGHGGADISPMKPAGVPLLGLSVDFSRYFDYHHSRADTLDKVDPRELSQSVAAMAVMAYALAEMPERLGAAAE